MTNMEAWERGADVNKRGSVGREENTGPGRLHEKSGPVSKQSSTASLSNRFFQFFERLSSTNLV